MMMNIRQNKGFTLIELMIVVVVIGILAAIAYPSFRDAVLKARRADAMDGIISIRLAQEKFRANCPVYGKIRVDNLTSGVDPCKPGDPTDDIGSNNSELVFSELSADEYYKLELSSANHISYIIRATPEPKGGQDEDKCGYFELKINKIGADGTVQSVQKLTESGDADRCWKR